MWLPCQNRVTDEDVALTEEFLSQKGVKPRPQNKTFPAIKRGKRIISTEQQNQVNGDTQLPLHL